ncbi:pyruvate formate lyase-domain-containing protein [Xylaria bambusicola]|uniref:pyruvate formate lyase-domain-containing protein n=1 Tax=Xylaria bambusicola TaxID=326684 RepID=UPI0020086A44|nr:pyruvate formate lyase-domain-containing protein [Xylaria bambusicola]KAI0505227.1 pyruvate formate lyase-domain-containing protein [Xylaria bambusicola]
MDRALRSALNAAQRGLPMRPLYGHILTVFLTKHDKETHDTLLALVQKLDDETIKNYPDSTFVVGFAPALWSRWTGRDIPINNEVLNHGLHFKDTGGDFLLYVKSPTKETANKIVSTIIGDLLKLADDIHTLELGKRPDGRVMGGRYVDHITNPNDPISLAEDILVDSAGPDNGSSFGFTQKFIFDWPDVTSQPGEALNAVIGRRPDGEIVSQQKYLTENAHINRAHTLDANLDQRKLLRQALPYDESNGHASREEGIMFVAFCNEQDRFEKILQNMLGDCPEKPVDRLMDFIKGAGGTYWYIPSAGELKVAGVTPGDDTYEDTHWQVRSKNGYMYYNHPDYMHQMAEGYYIAGDQPSVRVLSLLSRTFNHWRDGWMKNENFPRLPHLKDLLQIVNKEAIPESILERKGLANFATLAHILSSPNSKIAKLTGLVRITPKELVVGALPDFTLGRGKEVVTYLDDDEIMAAWLKCSLDESGAMGHIVPNFQTIVDQGLGAMIDNFDKLAQQAPPGSEKASFFISASDSFKGMQAYMENWADIANNALREVTSSDDRDNMEEVKDRFQRLVTERPQTFHDAVQLIFSAHCCLHLVGELTAFGRLDQILWPFLKDDLEQKRITLDRAQDIVDCLWIKIGEHAFVNRAFIYDYRGYGTGSVNGFGSNFHQGGGINQWVQQVTVGGYKATDADVPEGGANPVTLLCLRSARRIPVNAPSLSLRTYEGIPQEYIDEAAMAILSGGAQPTLYNDDKLCEGLFRAGKTVTRAWSRDYAADGCYEPMFTGASEFTLANVELLAALEQTINQGATYGAAGSVHLRGLKTTFRSPPVEEIASFDDLKGIFLKQLQWLIIKTYNLFLTGYGNWVGICPSPLLSGLIDGCVESGLDLTAGGAKFHLMGPMFIGVANTIDSLYAIKKLCYDRESARVTLPELLTCLICDWGYNMIEPYQDASLGPANAAANAVRYQELRKVALALPKWASGDRSEDLDMLGQWVISSMTQMCVDTLDEPSPAIKPLLDSIYAKHGPDFEFIVTPGVGTFEGYVGEGISFGASADGRRSGMPIASDMSPVPGPQDLPAAPAHRDIYAAMESYKNPAVEIGISNAAPVDMNIPEDFPLDRLKQFIRDFSDGNVGGNMVTLTCADLDTYQRASEDPEKYNLLRVRMGGWSEFYPTMFPEYQEQQQRRQYFTHAA